MSNRPDQFIALALFGVAARIAVTKIPIFNSPPPHCVYLIERPLPIFLPCSSAINLLTVPQRMALLPPKALPLEVPRSAAGRRRPVQAQPRHWAWTVRTHHRPLRALAVSLPFST